MSVFAILAKDVRSLFHELSWLPNDFQFLMVRVTKVDNKGDL